MKLVCDKRTGIHKSINNDGVILGIMIALSVIIRYLICGYTKTVTVYPDEMRYLSVARSLAKYGKRLYMNLPYNYENLLYQICLIPAALISDKVLQLKMMALTNCILLSFGVIPVYFLAKQCVRKRSSVWLACIIYLVSSDFAYSCTYLRENLYLPLSLWVLNILFRELQVLDSVKLDKKTIGFSLLSGGMIWLLFFCKRTCFPLLVTIVFYPFIKWLKNRRRYKKAEIHLKTLVNVFACVCGFFIPYLFLKYTVFYGDYVNQIDFRKTFEGIDLLYGNYFIIYYIIILFLAYTFFPFLITFNERHSISSSTRHLFYFTLISLLITTSWVAMNTNLGEDFARDLPRIHLRYLLIHYEPLIICMLAALDTDNNAKREKWLFWIPICFIVWSLYYLLVGSHLIVGDADLLQQTSLAYFALFGTKGQTLAWIVFSVLMMIGMLLYIRKNRKFKAFVLTVVICLNILNGALASFYFWPKHNQIDQKKIDSVTEVSEFIEENSNKTIVVFVSDNNKKLWHTYIDEPNVLWLDYDQFNSYVSELGEDEDRSWKKASKHITTTYLQEYYDFDHVDYIIWPSLMETTAGNEIDDMLAFNESDGIYSKLNEDTCVFALKNTESIPEIRFGNITNINGN